MCRWGMGTKGGDVPLGPLTAMFKTGMGSEKDVRVRLQG